MRLKSKLELREPIEFAWLLGLAFFLPLFEAPKNLCWLGYVSTWLYNRIRGRDWGGRWDGWDSLIVVWIASGYIVAAFAGVHHDEWSAANDILRYGSVLWLVKRSRYNERARLAVLSVLVASTLIALAWGYWTLYVSKTDVYLSLNSVGNVNHSAIYLAIVFGVALSLGLAYWSQLAVAGRMMIGLTTLALGISVFFTDSRAAALAAVLFALVFTLVFFARQGKRISTSVVAVGFAATVMLALNPGILEKTADQSAQGLVLSKRDKIWKNGLVEWRRFPLFGVGMGNFGRVTLVELQDWNKTQNWTIRPSAEGLYPHGHSLYVTALAERGAFGTAILLAVLLCWAGTLAQAIPRSQDPSVEWALFGAALAGWLITVVAGVVNTTLHHEHAILSVLLLALWLNHRAAPASPGQMESRPPARQPSS